MCECHSDEIRESLTVLEHLLLVLSASIWHIPFYFVIFCFIHFFCHCDFIYTSVKEMEEVLFDTSRCLILVHVFPYCSIWYRQPMNWIQRRKRLLITSYVSHLMLGMGLQKIREFFYTNRNYSWCYIMVPYDKGSSH